MLPLPLKTLEVVNWRNAINIMNRIPLKQLCYRYDFYPHINFCCIIRKYFRFDYNNFTNGHVPPIQCSVCLKFNHLKSECKEFELPRLINLNPLRPSYLEKLTKGLYDLQGILNVVFFF